MEELRQLKARRDRYVDAHDLAIEATMLIAAIPNPTAIAWRAARAELVTH